MTAEERVRRLDDSDANNPPCGHLAGSDNTVAIFCGQCVAAEIRAAVDEALAGLAGELRQQQQTPHGSEEGWWSGLQDALDRIDSRRAALRGES